MAVVKLGSTTLNSGAKGDKGDAGVSGASNPNVLIPTTQADISSEAVLKLIELQTDITLTSNLILPSDVTIIGGGGKILLNGFTVTGDNTNVISDDIYTTIFDNGGVINGTWKASSISGHWFGLISDETDQGVDNRVAFKNIATVANSSGSIEVHIYEGKYWFSVSFWYNLVYYSDNIMIGGNDDIKWIGHNATIQTLNHGYASSTIFHFNYGHRNEVRGFKLVGDKFGHDFSSPSTEGFATTIHEHNMGIMLSNGAIDCVISHNDFSNFTADGVYFKGQVFVGQTNLTDASFESGRIDNSGVSAVDGNFERTIDFIDLTNSQFADTGHFTLDINAGGKLDVLDYQVFFYDALDAFVGKTNDVEIFDRVNIPTDATKMKIVIYTNASLSSFKVINYDYAFGTIIEHNNIHHCIRQGISNCSPYTVVRNNFIHDIGGADLGITAGPCAGIDIEDGLRNNYNNWIHDNTFQNNAGTDVVLRYCRYTKVFNNTFEKDDKPLWNILGTAISNGGVSADYCRETLVYNNYFKGKTLDLGRYSQAHDNIFYGGEVVVYQSHTVIRDNLMYNTSFTRANLDYEYPNVSNVINNYIFWDRSNKEAGDNSRWIFNDQQDFNWINNTFDLNGMSDDSGMKISNILETTEDKLGVIDGTVIKNYSGTNGLQYHIHPINVYNSNFSCPLKVQFGFEKDFVIENTTITNYIDLDLRSFTEVTPSLFKTVTLRNVTLNVNDTGVLVGNYPFSAKAFNFNIKMIDCKINFNFNVAKTFQFLNTGYLYMENCEVIASTAETFDITASSVSSSTLINTKTKNFTFTATTQTGTVVLP